MGTSVYGNFVTRQMIVSTCLRVGKVGFVSTALGVGVLGLGLLFGLMALAMLTVEHAGPAVWFFAGIGLLLILIGVRWIRYRARDSWRSDPATDRQREFADELGIHYPKRITKGELSDLITEAKARRR